MIIKKNDIENKDQVYEQGTKFKCCGTCKYWKFDDIQKYCIKRTGKPEFAWRHNYCQNWELYTEQRKELKQELTNEKTYCSY